MALHYDDLKSIVTSVCADKIKSDVIHRDELEDVLTDILSRVLNSESVKQHLKSQLK